MYVERKDLFFFFVSGFCCSPSLISAFGLISSRLTGGVVGSGDGPLSTGIFSISMAWVCGSCSMMFVYISISQRMGCKEISKYVK